MAGRPRKYATNAEKQKAYRERHKPQALRNSVTALAELKAHNSTPHTVNADWIAKSTILFDQYMAARRAERDADRRQG